MQTSEARMILLLAKYINKFIAQHDPVLIEAKLDGGNIGEHEGNTDELSEAEIDELLSDDE